MLKNLFVKKDFDLALGYFHNIVTGLIIILSYSFSLANLVTDSLAGLNYPFFITHLFTDLITHLLTY